MSKSVEDQIRAILEEYVDQECEKIEKITKEVGQSVAKELKSTSPKSEGSGKHYASGWRVQNSKPNGVSGSISSVVYNATKPQLTHLLTYAHDIKNPYGTYGRSTPDSHIADAEQHGNELYLERLEKEL